MTTLTNLILLTVCVLLSFGALLGAFRLGKVFVYAYLSAYVFKASVALLDTPFMYLSHRMKPKELIKEPQNHLPH